METEKFKKIYGDLKNFDFYIYGSQSHQTEIFEFFDNTICTKDMKKIISILDAINTKPMKYRHPQKFKPLEGKLWEIKSYQIRIACFWISMMSRPVLIGVYAIIKKSDRWPSSKVECAIRNWDNCCKDIPGGTK